MYLRHIRIVLLLLLYETLQDPHDQADLHPLLHTELQPQIRYMQVHLHAGPAAAKEAGPAVLTKG